MDTTGRLTPEVKPEHISYPLAPKRVKQVIEFDETNWKDWFVTKFLQLNSAVDRNKIEECENQIMKNLCYVLIRHKSFIVTEDDNAYIASVIKKVLNHSNLNNENLVDSLICINKYLLKKI